MEDRDFPAMRHFPERFRLFEEFYQIRDFSRDRSHVLMSLDTTSLDKTRPGVRQSDIPLTWTRSYGTGRVFYSSLGHPPAAWALPDLRTMWLEAVKWTLGVEPASAANPPDWAAPATT